MPLTPEERAQIARENGAKSKGPVTPEGKAKSAQNALKHGNRAEKLALFLPPHETVLCNEDRQAYARLIDHITTLYQPANPLAASIVTEIASAQWQIQRFNHCLTIKWNLALARNAAQPLTVAEEMAELQVIDMTTDTLFQSNATVVRLYAEIQRLYRRVATLERRFYAAQRHITNDVRTQPVVETTPLTPETTEEIDTNEPPVFVTENTPDVIAAYRREFPGRKIIVFPPDDVAKGIEIEEDMPPAPRLQN